MYAHHSEVGGASGEGLIPPLSRGHLHNCGHNEDIGHHDEDTAARQHKGREPKNNHFVTGGVVTGKGDHRRDITEEVLDGVGVTERQVEYNDDDAQRKQEANHPRGRDELKADLMGHQDGVVQWLVNGSVTVIGHGSHDEAVIGSQAKEDKHLRGTLRKRNGLAVREQVR